ncbi:MAG: OmpA family protein [Chloroflexota bacterium]|nr:OmpA family protein [Chloroflexota bacterium]
MRSAGKILLALAGVLAANPVAAQSGGTVELGAFGRYTKFGKTLATDIVNNLPADNGFGGGLRFGIFLVRNLAIEADASLTKVDAAVAGDKVRHIPIHAGLTYNIPIGGKSAFLLGARYVRNNYGNDADFQDNGFGGVAGFRFGPLRLEGFLDKMTNDDPEHGTYHNWGVNAGLSLLLGGCNKSADGVTLSPTSVTLDRGERANFTATASRCGKDRPVTFTATGGAITESGEYTAGSSPGSYQVTATEPKSGLSSSATVTIKEPPPPPPPPPPMVTLTRIELTPERASVKMSESVSFQVRGVNSDGTTRSLSNCTYTATGNPTQSGSQFSWARPGNYTVTVQCEGKSDTSAVEVRLEVVLFGSNFAFNSSRLTASGLDTLRAAADSLKKYPEIMLRLGGHADFVGTDAYNCNLSWRRVRTVQDALRRFGIGDDRISMVEGFGEAHPVPDDQVPEEWKEINRQTRDKGKWWDRRVVITSGEKPAGMTACSEPPRR